MKEQVGIEKINLGGAVWSFFLHLAFVLRYASEVQNVRKIERFTVLEAKGKDRKIRGVCFILYTSAASAVAFCNGGPFFGMQGGWTQSERHGVWILLVCIYFLL